MSLVSVGIGDYHVSHNGDEELKAFALGSCVAVLMYDTVQKVAGLMHVALPDSTINPVKADQKPGYFADTGLRRLGQEMTARNATRATTWIKLAGGSNIMDAQSRFDIGKRNVLAIKKLLWKNQLGAVAEDVGGSHSRTVSISAATGEVVVSANGSLSLL